MTECPKCNGRGTVGYFHIDHFVDIECDRCHGSGEVSEVEMTNEEYLKSLDTEQLADEIADVCYGLLDDVWGNDGDTSCDYRETEKNYWVEWLKQPHTI